MRERIFFILLVFLYLFIAINITAQSLDLDDDSDVRGDAAVAEKYLLWAEDAIASGRWDDAHAALERAVDFADISSDISYLLAIVRAEEDESRGLVLQSLEHSIETGRWKYYSEAQARLMEADQLITLRRYSSALNSLAVYRNLAAENADFALLRLAALKGLADARPPANNEADPKPQIKLAPVEFRRRMLETMDNYPRDPRPLRILFTYANQREPDRDDIALMEIALRRLPFLLESDPELAWMAAPFIANDDEARRYTAAYRSGSLKIRQEPGFKPNPSSIIPALNLGLLDDKDAVDELFSEETLERELIVKITALLRSDEGRDYMARRLHTFTGSITDDEDKDGFAESRAVYVDGSLREYYYDVDQDGITNLFVMFVAGAPIQAELTSVPVSSGSRLQTLIRWERYPSVQTVSLRGETWLPRPGDFQFTPITFTELGASNAYTGLVFPQHNSRSSGINRRTLASIAVSVQRRSPEFEGGVEQIFLDHGRPIRSEVTLNGMIVSITEFENGYPLIQRLDMNLDGRMETVRHFEKGVLRSSESDWQGSGIFGSAELYRDDGSVVYSWDLDGDGIREYSSK